MAKTTRNWEARIGRRLRLRDLNILLAVVQSRSMAKAARELSVSQPAVSQAVAGLEHTLGVRLLDRSAQGVEPTAYGRALLKRSLAAFDELGQAVRDIEFLTDPTQGELRVGCPESIVAAFLPALLERFSRQHPQVIVHVEQINNVSPHFRELRDRKVDLVLARILNSFVAEDLEVENLIDDRPFVVAGTKSGWIGRRKARLADLVDDPWVLPSSETLAGSVTLQAFRAENLELPRARVVSLSTHLRCSLIASGHFLGILPGSVLRFNARRFSLKALPINLRTEANPVAVVTLKNRTLSPIAQLFIDSARAAMKSTSQER
jgi:DNA-binding transcriptional LysR family regulator